MGCQLLDQIEIATVGPKHWTTQFARCEKNEHVEHELAPIGRAQTLRARERAGGDACLNIGRSNSAPPCDRAGFQPKYLASGDALAGSRDGREPNVRAIGKLCDAGARVKEVRSRDQSLRAPRQLALAAIDVDAGVKQDRSYRRGSDVVRHVGQGGASPQRRPPPMRRHTLQSCVDIKDRCQNRPATVRPAR